VNSNSCGKGLVVFSLTFLLGSFITTTFFGFGVKENLNREKTERFILEPQTKEINRGTGTSGGDFGCGSVKNGICYPIAKLTLGATKDILKPEDMVPLRITSQPKPPYTTLARENDIQGFVRLRVIFLATGKIGDISPVSGLPDGLLENAISSAKDITFEPAKSNGVPQNVTKVVEYRFTIY
jgi:TonB family protein